MNSIYGFGTNNINPPDYYIDLPTEEFCSYCSEINRKLEHHDIDNICHQCGTCIIQVPINDGICSKCRGEELNYA